MKAKINGRMLLNQLIWVKLTPCGDCRCEVCVKEGVVIGSGLSRAHRKQAKYYTADGSQRNCESSLRETS